MCFNVTIDMILIIINKTFSFFNLLYSLRMYYYIYYLFPIRFPTCLVLKRAKKSKNDLINAEEGEDHFTDILSVGKIQAQRLWPLNSRWIFSQNQHRKSKAD